MYLLVVSSSSVLREDQKPGEDIVALLRGNGNGVSLPVLLLPLSLLTFLNFWREKRVEMRSKGKREQGKEGVFHQDGLAQTRVE